MTIDRHCRWVRHRLPLLAGGELGMDERRRVERHLIGCLGCRSRRESSAGALAVLRSVAGAPPRPVDAPSLWPSLERQIRGSRHLPARRPWIDRLGLRAVLAPWPAFGLSLGLGALAVAAATGLSAGRPASRPSVVAIAAPSRLPREATASPSRSRALPETPSRPAAPATRGDADPFEAPTSIRFEYVLDRGAPLGPGSSRDPQHSY